MQREPRATWALAALRQMPVPADNEMFSDLLAQIDRAERDAQRSQPQPAAREPHITQPPARSAEHEAPMRRLLSHAMRLTRTPPMTEKTPAQELSA